MTTVSAPESKSKNSFVGRGAELLALGYRLVPISPPGCGLPNAGKQPGQFDGQSWDDLPGWLDYDASQNLDELRSWPEVGSGIICGGGLLGIDVDVLLPEVAEAVVDFIRTTLGSVSVRYGREPKALIPVRYTGSFVQPAPRFRFDGLAVQQIELLSSGRQFVADGIHPGTGLRYRWEGAQLPGPTELPSCSQDQLRGILAFAKDQLAAAGGTKIPERDWYGSWDQIVDRASPGTLHDARLALSKCWVTRDGWEYGDADEVAFCARAWEDLEDLTTLAYDDFAADARSCYHNSAAKVDELRARKQRHTRVRRASNSPRRPPVFHRKEQADILKEAETYRIASLVAERAHQRRLVEEEVAYLPKAARKAVRRRFQQNTPPVTLWNITTGAGKTEDKIKVVVLANDMVMRRHLEEVAKFDNHVAKINAASWEDLLALRSPDSPAEAVVVPSALPAHVSGVIYCWDTGNTKEVANRAEAMGLTARIVLGRLNSYEGPDAMLSPAQDQERKRRNSEKVPCLRPEVVHIAGRAGISGAIFCKSRTESGDMVYCPHWDQCRCEWRYQAQFVDIQSVDLVVTLHNYLTIPPNEDIGWAQPDFIGIDEDPLNILLATSDYDRTGWSKIVGMARDTMVNGLDLGDLLDRVWHHLVAGEDVLAKLKEAGFTKKIIKSLISAYRVDPHQFRADASDADLLRKLPTTTEFARTVPQTIASRLMEEFDVGHELRCLRMVVPGIVQFSYRMDVKRIPRQSVVVVSSATADPDLLRRYIFPNRELDVVRIDIEENRSTTLTTGGKTGKRAHEDGGADIERRASAILWTERLDHPDGKMLVAVPGKAALRMFENAARGMEDVDIVPFGASTKGVDRYRDHRSVVVVGTVRPRAEAVIRSVLALEYDRRSEVDPEEEMVPVWIPFWLRKENGTLEAWEFLDFGFRSELLEKWRRRISQDEVTQTKARSRAIHDPERKFASVYNAVGIGMVVDDLRRMRDVEERGRTAHLRSVVEQVGELGWMLVMRPSWLVERTDYWETEKAAKRWLEELDADDTDHIRKMMRLESRVFRARMPGQRGQHGSVVFVWANRGVDFDDLMRAAGWAKWDHDPGYEGRKEVEEEEPEGDDLG